MKMVLNLIAIAEKKGELEKAKSFWNTYHCQSRLVTFEGRYYGKYCKNRFCLLCCSIRKAEIINRYYPVLKDWPEPYFVTLTVRAYPLKSLKVMVRGMVKAFKQITGRYRKMNQRGNTVQLMGIKSLECNFNPVRRTYNPHFHIIVPSKEIAEILVKEWLAVLVWANFNYLYPIEPSKFYTYTIPFRILAVIWVRKLSDDQNRDKFWNPFLAFFFPAITLIVMGQLRKLNLQFNVNTKYPQDVQLKELRAYAAKFLKRKRYNEAAFVYDYIVGHLPYEEIDADTYNHLVSLLNEGEEV